MTASEQAAAALRAVADQLETESDPHELLRLAALASWRLQEVVNLNTKEPDQNPTPKQNLL